MTCYIFYFVLKPSIATGKYNKSKFNNNSYTLISIINLYLFVIIIINLNSNRIWGIEKKWEKEKNNYFIDINKVNIYIGFLKGRNRMNI